MNSQLGAQQQSRRSFLKRSALLPMAAAATASLGGTIVGAATAPAMLEPIPRVGGSELKVSLNAYSFAKLLNDFNKKRGPGVSLVALLDFLGNRGKYLPLPLNKAATITSVKGMFISTDGDEQRLIFPKWGPQTAFGVPFQVIDPRGGSTCQMASHHSGSAGDGGFLRGAFSGAGPKASRSGL